MRNEKHYFFPPKVCFSVNHRKKKWLAILSLPAFIDEIYNKCAENKENEPSNEHVVDGPDVVDLKQLTVEEQTA